MGSLRHFKGGGTGSVILDGGMGGQSSYTSVDDYIDTVSARNPIKHQTPRGRGLDDKLSEKLRRLHIAPPVKPKKHKNITLSI
jgi:hypothetical protein